MLRQLLDTEEVTISFSDGNSGRAVVAFTGVGHQLGGIQTMEFKRTLSSTDTTNAVYHVIDKRRTWYEKTFDTIVACLEKELTKHDEVVTLGNSMGGFGAVLFGGVLPRCRRAIAFTPQFSLAPQIVTDNEARWLEYRTAIGEWKIEHALVHHSPTMTYFLLFGACGENWHIQQYRKLLTPNVGLYVIEGFDHGIAARLREQRALTEMINGLVNQDWSFDDLSAFMRSHGIAVTIPGDHATVDAGGTQVMQGC